MLPTSVVLCVIAYAPLSLVVAHHVSLLLVGG